MRPAYAQPPAPVTAEVQALNKRAADLCRRDPAIFCRAVRYADELEASGVDAVEALRLAMDAAHA